jgi:hypothetical protein
VKVVQRARMKAQVVQVPLVRKIKTKETMMKMLRDHKKSLRRRKSKSISTLIGALKTKYAKF